MKKLMLFMIVCLVLPLVACTQNTVESTPVDTLTKEDLEFLSEFEDFYTEYQLNADEFNIVMERYVKNQNELNKDRIYEVAVKIGDSYLTAKNIKPTGKFEKGYNYFLKGFSSYSKSVSAVQKSTYGDSSTHLPKALSYLDESTINIKRGKLEFEKVFEKFNYKEENPFTLD